MNLMKTLCERSERVMPYNRRLNEVLEQYAYRPAPRRR